MNAHDAKPVISKMPNLKKTGCVRKLYKQNVWNFLVLVEIEVSIPSQLMMTDSPYSTGLGEGFLTLGLVMFCWAGKESLLFFLPCELAGVGARVLFPSQH